MFDFGFTELLFIAVVALIVVGPARLPKVARTAGHLLGRLQRYVSDVKSDISREMQLEDLKKLQQQVEQQARDLEKSVRSEMNQVEGDLKKSTAEIEKSVAEIEKSVAVEENSVAVEEKSPAPVADKPPMPDTHPKSSVESAQVPDNQLPLGLEPTPVKQPVDKP